MQPGYLSDLVRPYLKIRYKTGLGAYSVGRPVGLGLPLASLTVSGRFFVTWLCLVPSSHAGLYGMECRELPLTLGCSCLHTYCCLCHASSSFSILWKGFSSDLTDKAICPFYTHSQGHIPQPCILAMVVMLCLCM